MRSQLEGCWVIQIEIPLRIGCVFHLAPIEIPGPVSPPDVAALAKRNLGLVNPGPGGFQCICIRARLGCLDLAPGSHQLIHASLTNLFAQGRIGTSPELSLDHKIPAIGCRRVHAINSRERLHPRQSGPSLARRAYPARTAWSALVCTAAGGSRPALKSWRSR